MCQETHIFTLGLCQQNPVKWSIMPGSICWSFISNISSLLTSISSGIAYFPLASPNLLFLSCVVRCIILIFTLCFAKSSLLLQMMSPSFHIVILPVLLNLNPFLSAKLSLSTYFPSNILLLSICLILNFTCSFLIQSYCNKSTNMLLLSLSLKKFFCNRSAPAAYSKQRAFAGAPPWPLHPWTS